MLKFIILIFALLSSPARAQTEVDLELVLMVDVSRSMTERELEIQRQGYAAALKSKEIYAAIRSGLLQSVALTYVEWASAQDVIVPWRIVKTEADLIAFADTLTARFDPSLRRTSISGALNYGTQLIENNDIAGLRRVIDISGDGPNNFGGIVTQARDATIAQGITINGLPLMTREGMGAQWHLDALDIYYTSCVIGGPGAFAIPVLDWQDFETAVRRKLILEIAGYTLPPRIHRAQGFANDPTDCLIGEKIWQNIRRSWEYLEP